VLILGDVGRNFAAGMSGGVAYVYDPSNQFANHCHIKAVTSEKILPACLPASADDLAAIYDLIVKHAKYTKSARAQLLLAQWEEQRHFFVKISARDVQGAVPEKLPTHVHTVLEKTITN
jgi:glutamate synthase domain-containing protein 3